MKFQETNSELVAVLGRHKEILRDKLDSMLLIAGISGAGRSTALRIIGDLGYYVVDNLPLGLFPDFLEDQFESSVKYKDLALTIDCSSAEKVEGLELLIQTMRKHEVPLVVLFLETRNAKLLQRYSETRRPHPVYDPELDDSIRDTIERERSLLAPIQALSSLVIDTTPLNIHDLKRTLSSFADSISAQPLAKVFISLHSFGFKHGMLNPCDLLLDVRFLTNPYFNEELRPLTGLDKRVSDYVMSNVESVELEKRFLHLLEFLLPRYIREGKTHITIGIGCTGGKHRSVTLVESLAQKIEIPGTIITRSHRDVER